MSKISQAEARRLRKRVAQLEELHQRMFATWVTDYPGIHLGNVVCTDAARQPSMVGVARKLGHAVVVVEDGQALRLYAVRP